MHRKALGILVLTIAVSLSFAACKQRSEGAGGAARKSVNWKMAGAYSSTTPIVGDSGPLWSKKLEHVSGGRLRIKYFDPGKLVPVLEIFDSVSKGAVDAGWTSAGYWIGKLPSAALFSAVPFGPNALEYMAWIYEGGGLDLWQEIYAENNIWVTPCVIIPPEASGWFREPIENVDQLRGMKIRFFGLGGKVMQKLGASVQLLAAGDIFPALERGVLDATEFSMPSIDERYGFHKIAKHYYFPGWHQQSSILELIINLARWNELSSQDQELIQICCKDAIIRGLTLGEVQQGQALANMKEQGVEIHTWSPEIMAAYKAATDQVLAEEATNDAKFAKVFESYTNFRARYAEWAALSRIPGDYVGDVAGGN